LVGGPLETGVRVAVAVADGMAVTSEVGACTEGVQLAKIKTTVRQSAIRFMFTSPCFMQGWFDFIPFPAVYWKSKICSFDSINK
jgi:hypothetical protein